MNWLISTRIRRIMVIRNLGPKWLKTRTEYAKLTIWIWLGIIVWRYTKTTRIKI
jgi:hypothetical protein